MVSQYCGTKAAVISIIQSAALELIRYGTNVNAIASGMVDTEMGTPADQLYARYPTAAWACRRTSPAPRCSWPRRMPDHVVGQTLNVDGGQSAQPTRSQV
jgi:D-sorbitol dehydrogenase (acceptor)